jgi:hypothetical protein
MLSVAVPEHKLILLNFLVVVFYVLVQKACLFYVTNKPIPSVIFTNPPGASPSAPLSQSGA